jgi:hypothetical protein
MFDMPYRRFDAFRDYVTITILAMGLVFIVSIFVIDITSPSVRYTTPSNEWVYFLDCSPTKPAARKALE